MSLLTIMATGLQFLRAAVNSGQASKRFLRQVTEAMFTEDELQAYRFVRDYMAQYRAVPTIGIVQEEGITLPPLRQNAEAGVDYFFDLLRKRKAYTVVNELHPQLTTAMRTRNTTDMLRVLREMVAGAASSIDGHRFSTLGDEAEGVWSKYLEAKANPGLRGITLGWPTMDYLTNGAEGGDVIALAGRPSMGKSYLLLEMAQAAWITGNSTAVVSMEMSLEQICRRWIARYLRINPNFIRKGELSTFGEQRLRAAIDAISNMPPVHLIAGDMHKEVAGIAAMIEEHSPDAVYIDSAYLMVPSARTGMVKGWEMLGKVMVELKQLASHYNIPIIGSFQFNRNVRSNSDKEADLSDVGGGDSIPQAASIVIGVRQGPAPFESTQRMVTVMKNREGETGRFPIAFEFSPMNFDEVELIESEQAEPLDMQWMN